MERRKIRNGGWLKPGALVALACSTGPQHDCPNCGWREGMAEGYRSTAWCVEALEDTYRYDNTRTVRIRSAIGRYKGALMHCRKDKMTRAPKETCNGAS